MLRIVIFFSVLFSIFLFPHIPVVVRWDQVAVQFLSLHRTPAWTSFFLFITQLGGTIGFVTVLAGGTLYFLIRKNKGKALLYFLGLGLLKLSDIPLKIWIARPRPPGGLLTLSTYSMPSGHAINAVLIFGVLGIFVLQKIKAPILRGLLFFLCLLSLFAVSFSRVYLGVHYPSDVWLGMLYAAAGLWVWEGIIPSFSSPGRP